MSHTRALVAALKDRLGASAPLPPPLPPRYVAPPVYVPAKKYEPSAFADEASAHTTALVGIGHAGTRYPTDVVLQFQAELAVAHAAVGAELPDDWAAANDLLPLRSRVTEHREFLLRPDLGRRLDPSSARELAARAKKHVDVQPILADGLSAVACMKSGPALLCAYVAACEARGLTVGTPVCAKFARVWLEDEIGEITGAKVACIMLGERPGLGTGDGLSAYLVHGPRVGKTDGDRNMMSNIHSRGAVPDVAGARLALLTAAMVEQGTSGVGLDLAHLGPELEAALARAPRAAQVRERLVFSER